MAKKQATVPTQSDIAQSVGVSRVTVSHILSGREIHRYSEETRRKVLAAAEQLGYRPHRAAQMMRSGRSNLIGVVHFGVANHSGRQIVHFLPQAISRSGYEALVVDLSWHGGSYRRALEYLVDARVEGVVIAGLVEPFGNEEINFLTGCGIPTVMLASNTSLGVPALFGDTRGIFCEMVEHLHQQGHCDIILLVNDYQSAPTLSRIAGFEEGVERLRSAGLRGRVIRLPADRNSFLSGFPAYQYTKKLIVEGALPDAIVCSNDQWAQSVFTAALEAGIQIPGELSVTGLDDEPFSANAPYYLTTAAADIGSRCEKAIEILMELMEGRELDKQHYIYPFKLIPRRSSGPAFKRKTVMHQAP